MTLSRHAQKRWSERLPELDVREEWANARRSTGRVGRRLIKLIRKHSPNHLAVTSRNFKGYYYRMSQRKVVFVVTPPEIIVTVFKLPSLS